MAFRIQQLTDDSKFSQALRFEVLEQLCPRELVSERLDQVPCLGRARAQPQPTPARLLRDLALLVSSAQSGSSAGPPGARTALAVVEPVAAVADSGSVGISSEATGDPGHAPPVSARLPTDGQRADQGGLLLRPAADGH